MTSVWAAKTPSYTKIMELDKRVREFPDPDCVQNTSETVARTMQSLVVVLYKETSACHSMQNSYATGADMPLYSAHQHASTVLLPGIEGLP